MTTRGINWRVRVLISTRLSLKCSAWKGFMSVQNFSFLARLEVAEKFGVGWGGGVVVQAKFRVQL